MSDDPRDHGVPPDAGADFPRIAAPVPTEEAPHDLPSASVREVQPQRAGKKKKYRYVVQSAPQQYYVYEETTSTRVTRVPLPSEHQAQDLANRYNDLQEPPR